MPRQFKSPDLRLPVLALVAIAPGLAVVTVGVAAMIASLAYWRRNYAIYTAGISFLAIALLGEQQGDFVDWAIRRAGDTLIGAAIALAAVYLVLPERNRRPDPEAAPPGPPGANGPPGAGV